MARIDRPILAEWFLKIFYLDFANKSYIAMLHVYHQMNNPLAYAAKECLFLSMADKSQFIFSLGEVGKDEKYLEEKSKERMRIIRVRNKFSVAMILMKYPKLRKRRKQYIAWVKERKRIAKENLEAELGGGGVMEGEIREIDKPDTNSKGAVFSTNLHRHQDSVDVLILPNKKAKELPPLSIDNTKDL